MSKRPSPSGPSLRSTLMLALVAAGCSGRAPEPTAAPTTPVAEPTPGSSESELSLGQVGLIAGHSSDAPTPEGEISHAEDELVIKGTVDRQSVWRVLEQHTAELERCYASSNKADLFGRAKIRFAIANTGEVVSSAVDEVTSDGDELAACVARAIKGWQFPTPESEGVVIVDYSFGFAPRGAPMQSTFADDWDQIETLGDVSVALPREPERLEVGEGPGASQLVVADEFGDAFALFDGPDEQLASALAYALDQLYGVEWGTAGAPTIGAASQQASFEAFGERYLALWHRRPSKVLLLAVVRPEREPRARAFVEGASERP